MTEPKLPVREAVIAARERLSALADRLARVRARLEGSSEVRPVVLPGAPPPPFGGADARPIDDLELTFRAVDVGNVGEAGQDKR